MKVLKIIILAIIIAFAATGMAYAGSQVKMNSKTSVSASVKNNTSRDVYAAVKLTAFDDAGSVVGTICRETRLKARRTTTVSDTWTAPGYATGLYWSSKVLPGQRCSGGDDDDHH